MASPQSSSPAPSCWICLDDEPDDNGKPVVRDCSCRGDDAGFAHVSCLISYANSKNAEQEKKELLQFGHYPVDLFGILNPWRFCPSCKQMHGGEVGMTLAMNLNKSAQDFPEDHIQRIIGSFAMADTIAKTIKDYPRALVHYKEVVDMGRRHPSYTQNSYLRMMLWQAFGGISSTAVDLGNLQEGIEARRECLMLSEEILGKDHPETQKHRYTLSHYESIAGRRYDHQGAVTHAIEKYEMLKAIYGDEKMETLDSKAFMGFGLCVDKKATEGLQLMEEAFQTCRRVYGPDHIETVSLKSKYQKAVLYYGPNQPALATIVGLKVKRGNVENGKEVEVLKLRQDGKYEVRLRGSEQKFKALPDNLEFQR